MRAKPIAYREARAKPGPNHRRRLFLENLETRRMFSFGPATNFVVGTNANPRSVAITDLNGDGKPDLVTANGSSNNVSVLLGTGTGSFGAASNFAVGTNPFSVAIADVNGDGKPDLVTANYSSNNVSVLLGTGTGSFGAASNFA